MKIANVLFLFLFVTGLNLQAQTPVGSQEESYYNFLALLGEVERPYLNYRTLSDGVWEDEQEWTIYGPQWYSSYNSTLPYGQNDGALWQGRGYNSSLTGGLRFSRFGLELTFKPQITFSQNLEFTIMPSAYESEYGYIWGYGYGKGADAPQRFGDDPFFTLSLGDSELRYTWKKLTVGLGTQSPWVGPGQINSIMHSNNAPPYPKFDIGVRRAKLNIGNLYLGDLEARLWLGMLSESDYFDTNDDNDQNLISALSLAYVPSFLSGLTLFLNRSYLSIWEPASLETIPSLLFFLFNRTGGGDAWDQRISLGFSYFLPSAGVEFYGEAGINDNPGPSLDAYIRNFSHTVVYTGGFKKQVDFGKESKLQGQLRFEWMTLEMSAVYSQFLWSNSFYMHHQVIQGYTNAGQWLGAGIGTGGNSQYLGFDIFYPNGAITLSIYRYNPDNDFLVRFTTPTDGKGFPENNIYEHDFKAVISVGINFSKYWSDNLLFELGSAYIQYHDPEYSGGWSYSTIEHGVQLKTVITYSF